MSRLEFLHRICFDRPQCELVPYELQKGQSDYKGKVGLGEQEVLQDNHYPPAQSLGSSMKMILTP